MLSRTTNNPTNHQNILLKKAWNGSEITGCYRSVSYFYWLYQFIFTTSAVLKTTSACYIDNLLANKYIIFIKRSC